jgi:hypothetical protein
MTCRELGIDAAQHRLVEKDTQHAWWLVPGSCELVRSASTIRSFVPVPIPPVTTPFPARTVPSGAPASRARATVVPIATMRPPRPRVPRIAAAIAARIEIRLIEREEIVELRVAGRGNAGGMGQRRKDDAAGAHRDNAPPVERKTRGRRSNATGAPAIGVRASQRASGAWHMRVLNRPSVARQAGLDRVGPPLETESHEPKVAEQRFDPRR